MKSGEVKALTDRNGPDGNPTVSPDGKWIAYTGYDDKNFTSHVAQPLRDGRDGRAEARVGRRAQRFAG